MRIGLALNPTTDRARSAGHATLAALGAAGHRVRDLTSDTYAATADAASAAVASGEVDVLVVVGGDGMVHLGVNAVAGTTVPLGVVAAGTGNDFARQAGLPAGSARAGVGALMAGLAREPACLDAGIVVCAERTVWFAGIVSVGLDAAVNAYANRVSWPRGKARYARAVLAELTRFRPYGYRVSVWGDDASEPVASVAGAAVSRGPGGQLVWQSPGTLVAVANSGWFGGGIRVAPSASLTDGLFDVVVAGEFSRVGAVGIFPGMYAGRHVSHPRVSVLHATRVLIEETEEGRPPPVAFADGEAIGRAPLEASVVAGALRVVGAGEEGHVPVVP